MRLVFLFTTTVPTHNSHARRSSTTVQKICLSKCPQKKIQFHKEVAAQMNLGTATRPISPVEVGKYQKVMTNAFTSFTNIFIFFLFQSNAPGPSSNARRTQKHVKWNTMTVSMATYVRCLTQNVKFQIHFLFQLITRFVRELPHILSVILFLTQQTAQSSTLAKGKDGADGLQTPWTVQSQLDLINLS